MYTSTHAIHCTRWSFLLPELFLHTYMVVTTHLRNASCSSSPPPPPPNDKTIEVKDDVHKLHCSYILHAYLQTASYIFLLLVKYMDVQLY